MRNLKSAFPLIGALLVACVSTASAANVTFQTPTYESADSDVSTSGMLAFAYAFTSDASPNPTVNGVTFTALTTFSNSNVTTNYVNSYDGFGSSSAPYANLSAGYKLLLAAGYYQGGSATITLNNLIIGHSYLFQYFVNDSRNLGGQGNQTLTGGTNSVVLFTNGSNGNYTGGSLGQFVIGNFTANATTQAITVTGTPQSQGFQLRDLSAVPEPRSYAMLALGVCGLLLARRRLRS